MEKEDTRASPLRDEKSKKNLHPPPSFSDEMSTTTPKSNSRITMTLTLVAMVILVLQLGLFLALALFDKEEGEATTRGEFGSSSLFHPTANLPVILLGLPRSGSLAIHEYFQCHGWKSAHYCCGHKTTLATTKFPCLDDAGPTCGDCVLKNLKGHRPAFSECGKNRGDEMITGMGVDVVVWSQFDVETADAWFLPQHFALGLLHQAYPNATWILNTRRSAREWAESVYHWHGMTRRLFTSFDLPVEPPHAMTIPPPSAKDKVTAEEIEQDMQRQLEARVYNQTEHLRKLALLQRIYENHTATVYQWARQFPSHPFVHLNVDDNGEDILSILDQTFGFFDDDKTSTTSQSRCHRQWNFQSPTEDWKDFSLPFGI
jgi:hypothetical protein